MQKGFIGLLVLLISFAIIFIVLFRDSIFAPGDTKGKSIIQTDIDSLDQTKSTVNSINQKTIEDQQQLGE